MDNSKTVWDINKIQEILPHRYPFIFVDRVISLDENKKQITCLKNLTINDYFFAGHFPDNPVMPGVLTIEALAQAAILLYAALKPQIAAQKPVYYLGKVEIKFSRPAKPGDCLILEVTGEKILGTAGIVAVRAMIDGETIAE